MVKTYVTNQNIGLILYTKEGLVNLLNFFNFMVTLIAFNLSLLYVYLLTRYLTGKVAIKDINSNAVTQYNNIYDLLVKRETILTNTVKLLTKSIDDYTKEKQQLLSLNDKTNKKRLKTLTKEIKKLDNEKRTIVDSCTKNKWNVATKSDLLNLHDHVGFVYFTNWEANIKFTYLYSILLLILAIFIPTSLSVYIAIFSFCGLLVGYKFKVRWEKIWLATRGKEAADLIFINFYTELMKVYQLNFILASIIFALLFNIYKLI
jgi:hypothetical protein